MGGIRQGGGRIAVLERRIGFFEGDGSGRFVYSIIAGTVLGGGRSWRLWGRRGGTGGRAAGGGGSRIGEAGSRGQHIRNLVLMLPQRSWSTGGGLYRRGYRGSWIITIACSSGGGGSSSFLLLLHFLRHTRFAWRFGGLIVGGSSSLCASPLPNRLHVARSLAFGPHARSRLAISIVSRPASPSWLDHDGIFNRPLGRFWRRSR